MDANRLIVSLEAFPKVLRACTAELSPDEPARRGPGASWSILEVVAHLADEESEDFRARLRSTIEDRMREWPAIDPEGAAASRGYNSRELAAEVERFSSERAASVEWLRSLDGVDWSTTHEHPRFGPISAGELMTSWVAHDQLHLRQITKRRFELAQHAGGFPTRYAGQWGA